MKCTENPHTFHKIILSTEKGFKKTENVELSVVLLLF